MRKNTNAHNSATPAERLAELPEDPMEFNLGWRPGMLDTENITVQGLWDKLISPLANPPPVVVKLLRMYTNDYVKRRQQLERLTQGLGQSRAMWRVNTAIPNRENRIANLERELEAARAEKQRLEEERDRLQADENRRVSHVMRDLDQQVRQSLRMLDDALTAIDEEQEKARDMLGNKRT